MSRRYRHRPGHALVAHPGRRLVSLVSHGSAFPKNSITQRQWRPVVVHQLWTTVRVRATLFGRGHTHAPERVELRTQ